LNTCQCLNPDCLKNNPLNRQVCQYCGQNLLLVQQYRAIRTLGQGGFGRTFLAIDESQPTTFPCVIKQFLPQAQGTSDLKLASSLFAQEAQRLAKLGKHHQIPIFIDYFIEGNRQYLIQEYIAGQTLAQELKEKGAFSEEEIWQLLNDILIILHFIHQNNVIHRDIKPDNLIRRKKDHKIFLVDFGASKVSEIQNITVTGTVIGSAEYTSPEQSMGKPKFCSDLYSLGVTCLHLLTQMSPFDLYSIEEGDWVWQDFLGDNPVSEQLAYILDKLIESAVKRRYQTADEVLKDIQVMKTAKVLSIIEPKQATTVQRKSPLSFPLQRFFFESVTLTIELEPPSLTSFGRRTRTIKEERYQGEAEYFTVDLTYTFFGVKMGKPVILEMVAIPAGEFLMGAPKSEAGSYDCERPQHWVTLQPLYMSKYPITQAQYQVIMGKNPSYFRGYIFGQNLPVETVSWGDAVKFCRRLSYKTGLNFSLPSESQWEYACRAGTTTPFYCGDTIRKDLVGHFEGETTEIGRFPPNRFGLYDIEGNVWEWCADTWHDNYNGIPIDGSAWVDSIQNAYVLRGGSFGSDIHFLRSAARISDRMRFHDRFTGFRVVCLP
jgi:formylglycine-generating enzyme required for sulfatase activity/tRNA A-37 threonylcarbamoyl transferase component Bud32